MSEPVDVDYASITSLDLSNQQLDVLPDLSMYINLIKLNCNCNNLTALDNLPPNLKSLCCCYNQITLLDNLPSSLLELYCYDNKLISLDNLPPNLLELYCYNNQITLLDNLPSSLLKLSCYGNPIIYDFEPTLENIRNYNATRIA